MTISESILVASFIMGTVFLLLAAIFLLMKAFSFLIQMFEKYKRTLQKEPQTLNHVTDTLMIKEQEQSSGILQLSEVDEATAAIIMAIVCDESGIPLNELCFRSIKLLHPEKENQEGIA